MSGADMRELMVRDLMLALPAVKRDALKRAAEIGNMSIGAAIAYSLAQQPIRDYAPPGERAKVAGLLMRAFMESAP